MRLAAPAPPFIKDAATLNSLNEAFLVDISQLLATAGYKAGDLRRDEVQRDRLVNAAAARLRGSATIEQEAFLADTVIIGKVVEAAGPIAGSDGFRSTVAIQIDQAVKGGDQVGSTVSVRRLSGSEGERGKVLVTSEDPVPSGTVVALIGSRAEYRAAQAGNGACQNCVVEQLPIFIVSGTNLIPTGGYQRTGTVGDLQRGVGR